MFVRVKKIGAYEYLYLVENAREGGRHVQRVIKALGRRDEVETSGLIDGLIASAARHSRRSIVLSSFYRGDLPELHRLSIGPDLVVRYPSAGGRLFGIGGMIEGWGFRFRRVMGSVHKLDYGHKFAGSASAPVVARGAEAGDCCGLAGTGVIGIGGGTALRRECEPGFCLAQALSRTGQHISSSATGAGDGDAGSAVRALTGVDERVDRN